MLTTNGFVQEIFFKILAYGIKRHDIRQIVKTLFYYYLYNHAIFFTREIMATSP